MAFLSSLERYPTNVNYVYHKQWLDVDAMQCLRCRHCLFIMYLYVKCISRNIEFKFESVSIQFCDSLAILGSDHVLYVYFASEFVIWLNCCVVNFDGLVQERRNSIASTLELRLSCTNPSMLYPDSLPQIWPTSPPLPLNAATWPR